MLVLSRKIGEVITIGNDVKITVLSFDRGVVRLGIEAPKNIPVHRKEVFDKIIQMNKQAAKTELSAFKNVITNANVQIAAEANEIPSPALNFAGKSDNEDKQ